VSLAYLENQRTTLNAWFDQRWWDRKTTWHQTLFENLSCIVGEKEPRWADRPNGAAQVDPCSSGCRARNPGERDDGGSHG